MEVDNSAESNAARTVVSGELLTKEAIAEMKAWLPQYVVNCFEAAGYDTLAVIADMDVSDQPGNSLDEIEQFITSAYPNNPKYYRDTTATGPFKFPPGHRKRICKFVAEILSEYRAKKTTSLAGKRPIEDVTKTKAKKSKSNDPEDGPRYDTTVTLAGNIRRQVTKWQRSQKIPQLRELKEHEQFEVAVAVNEGNNPSASLTCKICAQKCALGFKEGKCLISNWTRHVSKCVNSPKRGYKETNLYKSPQSTASSSADGHTSVFLNPACEKSTSSVEQQTPPQKGTVYSTALDVDPTDPVMSVEGGHSQIGEETEKGAQKGTKDTNPLVCDPVGPMNVEDTERRSSEERGKEKKPFRLTPPVMTSRDSKRREEK